MSAGYIFIAGASRGVGREIANCLTAQKKQIKVLLRTEDKRQELEAIGIKAEGVTIQPKMLAI